MYLNPFQAANPSHVLPQAWNITTQWAEATFSRDELGWWCPERGDSPATPSDDTKRDDVLNRYPHTFPGLHFRWSAERCVRKTMAEFYRTIRKDAVVETLRDRSRGDYNSYQ